jgi:two-component system chemotaxis response regulator CheY
MTLAETLLRQLDDPTLSRDARAQLLCQLAADLERRGQYESARAALSELWQGVGQRPALEGLSELAAAEVLLRVGTLSGWFGSTRQLEGAQDAAKDLISESIARFRALGETTRAIAAQSELGLCYKRAGAYDEARVIYHEALKELAEDNGKGPQAEILLRLAIVEADTSHHNDALRILTDSAELFDESTDNALKGKFHNEFACVFTRLAKAERRPDYIDRAIIEYTAASHHFEQAGHTGYRASAENNLGFLLHLVGRYEEAHEHLNRARALFLSVKDKGRIAQVDETRARILLAQGMTRKAEHVIREAVRTLEKGGEQALLAEALTTQGRVLAKIGNFAESLSTLRRAAELAEMAGAVEDAGLALLTLVEEHIERVGEYEALDAYQRANNLLRQTQDAETIARVRNCASRIVSARLAAIRPKRERSLTDFWANFNLHERVRAYESRYIQRALIDAAGSVTRAARLLGFNHPAKLTCMLASRHQDLMRLRTPPERRRHGVLRVRAPQHTGQCKTPKATQPVTILHVEDSRVVAKAVKDMLESKGWKVELCENGTSAMSKLEGGSHYDLLIFDHGLPGANGLELIRYARSLSHYRQTPIIMLSASDFKAQALSAGANVFLRKPEDIDVLVETIKRLLDATTTGSYQNDKMKDAGHLQEEGFRLLRESTKLLEEARSALARGEHNEASELMRQSAEMRQESQELLDKAAKLLG